MTDEICVAFQGEPGAYSEAAVLEFFDPTIHTRPLPNFIDVFQAVEQGSCTFGFIPIENSLAGSIHQNYDLMLRYKLNIVGEYPYRVEHCLLAIKDAEITDIKRVHSHPQALAQCAENLRRLKVTTIPEADTAGSARLVAENNTDIDAAIASSHAAKVYGLQVLIENLEDNPANFTRFLVLAREDAMNAMHDETGFKTSIVFSLPNQPGALFKALSVFALRDIDLTKIESRPIHGKPWQYMFYIDFLGRQSDKVCQRALDHLQELTPYFRILGSYPRHQTSFGSGADE